MNRFTYDERRQYRIYDPRGGGEGTGGDEMSRLWNWCAFCGKGIETGEKCYGLPNGESVCTDCCVAENEGADVSDEEEEQEDDNG